LIPIVVAKVRFCTSGTSAAVQVQQNVVFGLFLLVQSTGAIATHSNT
jgi:hypothetical protein